MIINRDGSELQVSQDMRFGLLVFDCLNIKPEITSAEDLALELGFQYSNQFLENLQRIGLEVD